eukprot:1682315-Rhodomonas_salina.1
MKFDARVNRWRCIRADDLWVGISCPAGMFKRSRADVAVGCNEQGTPCPAGYECACRPCQRGQEVE